MAADKALPAGLKYGSLLVVVGGLVPLLVSTLLFGAFLKSQANPDQPWLSGQVMPGPASYTFNGIKAFNPELATDFMTAQHIELANVMNSGALVAILGWFGLRRCQRWAWWAILFTALWPGLNDAWALLQAEQPPIPLLGEAVVISGLLLARPAVFGSPVPEAKTASAAG